MTGISIFFDHDLGLKIHLQILLFCNQESLHAVGRNGSNDITLLHFCLLIKNTCFGQCISLALIGGIVRKRADLRIEVRGTMSFSFLKLSFPPHCAFKLFLPLKTYTTQYTFSLTTYLLLESRTQCLITLKDNLKKKNMVPKYHFHQKLIQYPLLPTYGRNCGEVGHIYSKCFLKRNIFCYRLVYENKTNELS